MGQRKDDITGTADTDESCVGIGGRPSDIDLMLRVRATGDTEAFALLAGRYRIPLRRFFAALLPAGAPADDFAQETLLRLWLSRERYQPTGKFSAYLFQIARHYFLNQRLRYRARASCEVSADGHVDRLDDGENGVVLRETTRPEPEAALLKRLERERSRRAIDDLPAHFRKVFVLSHVDGLRYAEIAERLGIPVGTVKSRMAEAVRRLRLALTSEE